MRKTEPQRGILHGQLWTAEEQQDTIYTQLSFNMEEDEFIGEKTFQHYCAEFIKHSQQIGDSWEWRPSKDCSDGYMCKIHFQIKSGSVMSHPGASTHGQTCPPMETLGFTCKESLEQQ
ncbi:ubiquitin-like-conjugating enzyme ATG10 isoform X11 [Macaca fascicularis]|uniref:ubiquitin-like-conjugating enzyme ATG10 isoform X11 n=1 Tax=Macaca fascicularis TaxID=9541 RepID=UPI003D15DA5C